MILVPLVSQNFQTQGVLSGTAAVSQGNVSGGYVDLASNQTISGNKILLADLIVSGTFLAGNLSLPNKGEGATFYNTLVLVSPVDNATNIVKFYGNAFSNGFMSFGYPTNTIYANGSTAALSISHIVNTSAAGANVSSDGFWVNGNNSYDSNYRAGRAGATADVGLGRNGIGVYKITDGSLTADGWGKLIVSGIENVGMTGYAGGLQTYESSAGTLCISGSCIPGGPARTLGNANAKWSDVFSTLINSADYVYDNNWRTMELEKFPGYPEGVAIVSNTLNPPIGKIKNPMEGKPTFAVADEFIEINGRRITMDQLDKLLDLVK